MGDHGIFEPLFDPEVTSDEALDRMQHDSSEAVERHLRRSAQPHKLVIERFVEEWPDTVEWLRSAARDRARARTASVLGAVEHRMLKVVGKVIDATHKAQLDRRAAAQRAGFKDYTRPAVHVIGQYMNPVFRAIGELRSSALGRHGEDDE